MQAIGQVLYVILLLFIALLWVRFVVDWVQVFARRWEPRGPLLVALEGVYSATDALPLCPTSPSAVVRPRSRQESWPR